MSTVNRTRARRAKYPQRRTARTSRGARTPPRRAPRPAIAQGRMIPRPQIRRRRPRPGVDLRRDRYAAVQVPTAISTTVRQTLYGDVVVSNRELMSTITPVTAGFEIAVSIGINPGLINFSPWLSGIAAHFDLYRFDRLEVHWVPSVSTSAPGQALIAIDYDSNDSPPSTKAQMMTFDGAISTSLWQPSVFHAKSRSQFAKFQFVRTGSETNVTDYDLGTMYLATDGVTATTALGDFYVEYTVRFKRPTSLVDVLGATIINEMSNSTGVALASSQEIITDGQTILNMTSATTNTGSVSYGFNGTPAAFNSSIVTPAVATESGGLLSSGFNYVFLRDTPACFTFSGTYSNTQVLSGGSSVAFNTAALIAMGWTIIANYLPTGSNSVNELVPVSLMGMHTPPAPALTLLNSAASLFLQPLLTIISGTVTSGTLKTPNFTLSVSLCGQESIGAAPMLNRTGLVRRQTFDPTHRYIAPADDEGEDSEEDGLTQPARLVEEATSTPLVAVHPITRRVTLRL